ncbi:MAG TPA: TonB family protein [Candidatus Angelobacter sp.]|nr:TonB family protein [Candidatus Angelobacter sp.]
MTTAIANPQSLNLRSYLGYSVLFHVLLATTALVATFVGRTGKEWGGTGSNLGGTAVTLVRNAGIPMPRESMVTESKVVDPAKTLHKEEPPKPPEPKTDAMKIPKFTKEKQLPPSPKSRVLENKTPTQDNDVPGLGGTPNLQTGYSQTPGPSSGATVLGQGGGDFGARYPWYVDAVRNRVQQSWDQSTIQAAVRAARHAHTVMTFRISANGSISNIRLLQGSGDWSMDNSAQRALQSIDTFRPLPNDYMGSYVDVTFDFDLSLAQ